jgi:glutathione S-transferase
MESPHTNGESVPQKENLKLVIGDKNFSSWSMRPWLALKASGLVFEEINIQLDSPKSAKLIAKHSPSGRVPVLWHDDVQIWDSLAICEYVNELAPDKYLWPRAKLDRARARSYVSEMHSGFPSLRSQLSMDIGLKMEMSHLLIGTISDIKRVLEIWKECLKKSKGEYLFGGFGIADAYFAPVVFRFLSYGVQIENAAIRNYMQTVKTNPFVKEWVQGARKEKPYRHTFR